jgi:cytochrome c553
MVMVHQGHSTQPVPTHVPGGYNQGGSVVDSECSVMTPDGQASHFSMFGTVLPVDVAVSPDGSYAAVVGAGDGFTSPLPELTFVALTPQTPGTTSQVLFGDAGASLLVNPGTNSGPASAGSLASSGVTFSGSFASTGSATSGMVSFGGPLSPEQPVSVAFDGIGHVLVQMREPAQLRILGPAVNASMFNPIGGTVVALSTISRADTGHDIFHASAGALIACASCHPEGGDDGHVWLLDSNPRRTPSLRGTIAGTAPYHWPGDEMDFPTLTADVYTGRMGGAMLSGDQVSALATWVQNIPAPPAPSWVDAASAQRGRAVFGGPTAGCASCHSGPKLTNNQTTAVGTCGAFQVPPLVGLGWRTPLMHNGCAGTIAERFTRCSTPGHGDLAGLSQQNLSDLTAYLETL